MTPPHCCLFMSLQVFWSLTVCFIWFWSGGSRLVLAGAWDGMGSAHMSGVRLVT